MKTIQEYEIVDHGIEHEQYFQGCGTAFTRFETVATGIGNGLKQALNDAADQLAEQGYEISNELQSEIDSLDSKETEETHTDCGDEECYSQDVYYYASIRVR